MLNHRSMKIWLAAPAAICAATLCSCDESKVPPSVPASGSAANAVPAPTSTPASAEPAASPADSPVASGGEQPSADPATEAVVVAGVQFPKVKSWAFSPGSSAMRAAEAVVSGESGDAKLVFYYFGAGQGGGVDVNINRWVGQVKDETGGPVEPEVSERTVAGLSITTVYLTGTYADGMPGGETTPRPGYALLGAIVEGPKGGIFLKMTGPRATVDGARADLDGMLDGITVAP